MQVELGGFQFLAEKKNFCIPSKKIHLVHRTNGVLSYQPNVYGGKTWFVVNGILNF